MRNIYFLVSIIILIFSCKREYQEYAKTDSGLLYKLHRIGDGEAHPKKGEYVLLNMILRSLHKGEVLRVDSHIVVKIVDPYDGNIQEGLSLLVVGDSATFLIKRPAISNPDSLKNYELNVEILDILDENRYKKEKEYISWKADQEMNELISLRKYLKVHGIDETKNTGGVYFQEYEKGTGQNIKSGDFVSIHYKGYFISNDIFDSTYENDTPLEFNFGDPDQVIRGFELALSKMNKNSKAKIIIPSQLAFGEMGSSTGIIPPYTTLVYELEVVKKITSN